jgi:hypothetical protein
MTMTDQRKRPPLTFEAYYAAIIAFTMGLPLAVVASKAGDEPVPAAYWTFSETWFGVLLLAFTYGALRCSSKRLSYFNGYRWVISSMGTGWASSILFILPSVILTILASGALAFYGDIRRNRAIAQEGFQKVIGFFYRNRMRS